MDSNNENKLSNERIYEILNCALDIMVTNAICSDQCMRGNETEFVCRELEITEDEFFAIRGYDF